MPSKLLVAAALLLLACEDRAPAVSPSVSPPAVPPSAPAAVDPSVARARDTAKRLGQTLKQRLVATMQAEGPPAAIKVCAEEAQVLTAAAQADGVRVGRASLRARSPRNEPPPWVRQWLEAQGERPAAGLEPIAEVRDGQARFLAPLVIEGPCLNCHGPLDSLMPEVRAVLQERYPSDAATGYAEGDLRGALWAEVDVP